MLTGSSTIKRLDKCAVVTLELEKPIDSIIQVTVVAYIASIQAQATNSQYVLDDGSGRIEARHWTDSSMEDESEKNGIV